LEALALHSLLREALEPADACVIGVPPLPSLNQLPPAKEVQPLRPLEVEDATNFEGYPSDMGQLWKGTHMKAHAHGGGDVISLIPRIGLDRSVPSDEGPKLWFKVREFGTTSKAEDSV